ncbi:phage tail protein [Streptomyces spongiae]|uniref:Uncharacterized protein n=1 Tax=Streptomyces spongiae TaxID=565072 RepID=A0A5N8X975_9ACTN|nr:hypothetical protein [Streptomyces spongiae]MPY55726.1 hypothetical protein [Streptomyces spongiae]
MALGPLAAGGLTAVQAEWGVDGGAVVLTGAAPFADVTGSAGFRSDGSLDGVVRMRTGVRFLGLALGEVAWTVHDWSAEVPLATPTVTLRGSTLAVDLGPLPQGATWTAPNGIDSPRHGDRVVVHLPGDAMPSGLPLSPRVAEVYRGLGLDVSHLRVHPDTQVGGAPAFVTDQNLFLAPGIHGADSPEALRVLDAAVRAALTGLLGAVGGDPAQVVPRSPAEPEAPAAETSVVPATVPESPTGPAASAGAGAGAAERAGEVTASLETAPVTEGGAAEGVPEEPSAETSPPPTVQLIMPEPPTDLTPAAAARGTAVKGGAGGAARAARDLPTADAAVADSRAAVTEPAAETAARAREELAAELGARPAPSPEIVELCERIRTAIRANRPEDEDELLESDPTKEARKAGSTITGSVEGQVQQVGNSYGAMASPPPGTPTLTPEPLQKPSPTSPGMGVEAASAAPDPIPPENTSLDADVAATDQRITDSGIDTRVTKEIPDGPFAAARDARAGLGEVAERTPQQIQAEQQQAIDSAQADMAQLQEQAVAAMRGTRSGTVKAVGGGQTAAVASEERTRESVARHAQQIYDDAQKQVDALLQPLSRTAIARWDAGLSRLSQEFHDSLDRVKRWIDERHSGVGGAVLAIGDYISGLPDWVTDEYNRAERTFGDGVCELLTTISSDVNGVVAAAQAVIQHARTDIDGVFQAMEAEFPEWAAQERARFGGMLDALSQRVTEAQTGFVRDVSQRAVAAVNQVHAEAQALREEAGGLIGRVVAAIEEFIDDPVRAVINGLLRLAGIPPAAFWALIAKVEQVISDIAEDPETFVNNLVAGVRQGFEQFFDHFGTHVLRGFWDWLFSGLKTPAPMPRDLSAKSLFTFALQLMGITWPRVREILVRHIGPTAVEVVETAWQFVSVLIERGPEGLVELLKEQLAPENVVGMILEAAVDYLVETLIEQVTVRVVGLLNPAGAIAQAIDLIYQVCAWIFRNAARIFRLVEAVVNGMADVVAGNITGLATSVEKALASLIPPVIDFLAGILHLGDLPGEVAEAITRLQAVVYAAMDRVIGYLAAKAIALLKRLGIGGKEDSEGGGDDELGTTVRFSAAHEGHRLFFRVAGDDAALMVASVPQPIESVISEWRDRLGELPDEQRAPTATKLDALAAVADETNKEGAELAREFLEANRDPDDSVKPPSDNTVEARERAVAGMLRELFEIFDETGSEATYLADIAANLPLHGRARAGDVTDLWARRYSGPPLYVPLDASAPATVWNPADLAGPAVSAGQAYLGREDVQRELLPYFTKSGKGGKTARRADTGAFRDYALVETGQSHPVRQGFLDALGEAYRSGMASRPPQNIDPVDSKLSETVASVEYENDTAPYGAFADLPGRGDEPDQALVERAQDIRAFLLGIARDRTFNEYSAVRLQWAWTDKPTKEWLNRRFRIKGQHEWIPTNLLPHLLRKAFDAHLDPVALALAVKWIEFQYELRSRTNFVLWHFDPGLAGHVGSFSKDERGRHSAGTAQSHAFHEWLRGLYDQHKDTGPYAFAIAVMTDIDKRVWSGNTEGISAERLNDPIGVWYKLEGVGRVADLTIGDLAEVQRGNYLDIIRDFERALEIVGW